MPRTTLLVLLILLAGCAGSKGATMTSPTVAPETQLPASAGTGQIVGQVTDQEARPIEKATIAVPEHNLVAESDAEGRFKFGNLPAGDVVLHVARLGFESVARRVTIPDGGSVDVNVRLVAVPVQAEPRYVSASKDGRMACGFAIKPIFEDNLVCYYLNKTSSGGFPIGFTSVKLQTPDVAEITGMVFETVWTPNQQTGKDLRIIWWTGYKHDGYGSPTENTWRTYASAAGPSPMRFVVDETKFQDTTFKPSPAGLCMPGKPPCRLHVDTRASGSTIGQAVDVALYVDQRFTHWVTEFVGLEPSDDFSALPK